MMNSDLFRALSQVAFRNLLRNKKRNLATGIAICAGFVAFMLAAGYAIRVHNVLSNYTIYGLRTGHVVVTPANAIEMGPIEPKNYSFNTDQIAKINAVISELNGIEMQSMSLSVQGIIGNGCKSFPYMAQGMTLEGLKYADSHPLLKKWAPHIEISRVGKPIWNYPQGTSVVGLSNGLMRLLGKTKTFDQMPADQKILIPDCTSSTAAEQVSIDSNVQLVSSTWSGQSYAIDADVAQVFSTGLVETNNSSILLELSKVQELLDTNKIASIHIWLADVSRTSRVIGELSDRFSSLDFKVDVLGWNNEKIGPYYTGSMRFIVVIVAFLGLVLAVVIALSIFNASTMTVIERSEEVGMLRSMGYTKALVRRIFVLESVFLTMLSAIVGAFLGVICIFILNRLGITFNPPGTEGGLQLILVVDPLTILAAALCTGLLGVIATGLAVRVISEKNISELIAGSHR